MSEKGTSMEPMESALLADGSGDDWEHSDPESTGRSTYWVTVLKPDTDGDFSDCSEEVCALLSPLPGFGVGSVFNAMEKGGLLVIACSELPTYLPEDQLREREIGMILRGLVP